MNLPIQKTFQFCPQCGAKSDSESETSFQCSKCGFVLFFSPYTAVGAILVDSRGRVLFIRRSKDPGKGKLGLPGGFVDPGETIEEALVREVFEEVNLKVLTFEYLTSFPNSYSYRGITSPVTDLFFECGVESFESISAQESEVSEYLFEIPEIEILDQMAFESNRKALEFYKSKNEESLP